MIKKKLKPITISVGFFILLNVILLLINFVQINRRNIVKEKYFTFIENNKNKTDDKSFLYEKGIYQGSLFLFENYKKYRDNFPLTKEEIIKDIESSKDNDLSLKVAQLTHQVNIGIINGLYFTPFDHKLVIGIDLLLFFRLIIKFIRLKRKK